MPPVPVTISSRPSASSKSGPINSGASKRYHLYPSTTPSPLYYSITTSPKLDNSTVPTITQTPVPDSSSSSTPSPATITLTVAPLPHRRKSKHILPGGPVASLTPLLQPIISRCLHTQSSSPNSTHNPLPSPPKKNGHNGFKKAPRPVPAPVHPYSRQWDTTNDRSTNPSPKEIAKAQRMELEKVKVREDSAAVARAAAAAKRRKGKSRATSKVQAGRSESPKEKPAVLEGDNSANVPTITTEPASNSNSPTLSAPAPQPPAPVPPRAGLKRTRSIGLGISTSTANNANGQMAVGSPLRAVTGPSSPEHDGARESKRTRLSDSEGSRMTRRASSGSPVIANQNLPNVSGTSVRRGSATGLTSEATAMRRAVSATTLAQGAGSRGMARTGSAGSSGSMGEALAAGRDRARREVTLPGRLRDYEMRAGTTT